VHLREQNLYVNLWGRRWRKDTAEEEEKEKPHI
jgi:hypothetical protein